ncbi:MAG TPA: hypothetical protein VIE89_20920 [Candidatus Binatia bacterium]|jgi:hypothetical protein|nr:hypothetical protein [Candidatus Udaeobacter sp.]
MTDEMVFAIIALVAALCGVIMVIGCIILLREGVIKLSEIADKGKSVFEIKNFIKFTTSYPALGMFLIGVVFVALALYFTKPAIDMPIRITGHLDVPDPSGIRIEADSDQVVGHNLDSAGNFDEPMQYGTSNVRLQFFASGYTPVPPQPMPIVRKVKVQRGLFNSQPTVKIPGDIKFEKVASNPGVGHLEHAPDEKDLPKLNAKPGF